MRTKGILLVFIDKVPQTRIYVTAGCLLLVFEAKLTIAAEINWCNIARYGLRNDGKTRVSTRVCLYN
jgi:hypothetical protein